MKAIKRIDLSYQLAHISLNHSFKLLINLLSVAASFQSKTGAHFMKHLRVKITIVSPSEQNSHIKRLLYYFFTKFNVNYE